MDQYPRAKQVECPVCEAGINQPCRDTRESRGTLGVGWSPRRMIQRPHKQRLVKADGGA